MSDEELLKKANLPAKKANKWHEFYKGKIESVPKCSINSYDDFAVWYTPGVAEPCKEISNNTAKVYDHTNKGNNIAIISDGSRVLGLGDIGPHAGLPVMEGKSLLFKYLGGVDATPIMLNTKDKDEIIKICKNISPSFGGINLEDIASPKCFEILDELRSSLEIPVWHDDQQGTALVILAGLFNALELADKSIKDSKISLIGSGAANIALYRLLKHAGANPNNFIVVDSKGIINKNRTDLASHPLKMNIMNETNVDQRNGKIQESLVDVDICIALSLPGPGIIKPSWIEKMNKNAIVFACANPIPEIWPWEAKDAGAKIVATGRSDLPNQANNSLGFPGIFRGALDIRAKTITDGMCIAASKELASFAKDKGISDDRILPTMEDSEVFAREAVAVAEQAMKEGIAGINKTKTEIFDNAIEIINRSQNIHKTMLSSGFIKNPPE